MTRDAEPIRFGIVGSGWRSDFFLEIAKQAPERFEVTGLVSRSADTRPAPFEKLSAGATPKTMPVTRETAAVNVSTPRSSPAPAARGRFAG